MTNLKVNGVTGTNLNAIVGAQLRFTGDLTGFSDGSSIAIKVLPLTPAPSTRVIGVQNRSSYVYNNKLSYILTPKHNSFTVYDTVFKLEFYEDATYSTYLGSSPIFKLVGGSVGTTSDYLVSRVSSSVPKPNYFYYRNVFTDIYGGEYAGASSNVDGLPNKYAYDLVRSGAVNTVSRNNGWITNWVNDMFKPENAYMFLSRFSDNYSHIAPDPAPKKPFNVLLTTYHSRWTGAGRAVGFYAYNYSQRRMELFVQHATGRAGYSFGRYNVTWPFPESEPLKGNLSLPTYFVEGKQSPTGYMNIAVNFDEFGSGTIN